MIRSLAISCALVVPLVGYAPQALATDVSEAVNEPPTKAWRVQARIGWQGASAKVDSFGTYMDGQYNNSQESRRLGGAHTGVSVVWQERGLADLDMSLLTRLSGSVAFNLYSASLGYVFYQGDALSAYAMAGHTSTEAIRRNRRLRFDDDDTLGSSWNKREQKEGGAHGIVGLHWRAAPQWTLSPSYRYVDVRDGGLHLWQLHNHWRLNQRFGLSLSANYLHWGQARQPGWQMGLVFDF